MESRVQRNHGMKTTCVHDRSGFKSTVSSFFQSRARSSRRDCALHCKRTTSIDEWLRGWLAHLRCAGHAVCCAATRAPSLRARGIEPRGPACYSVVKDQMRSVNDATQTAADQKPTSSNSRDCLDADWVCPICLDDDGSPSFKLSCGHAFCQICLQTWVKQSGRKVACACCRRSIGSTDMAKISCLRDGVVEWHTPPGMLAPIGQRYTVSNSSDSSQEPPLANWSAAADWSASMDQFTARMAAIRRGARGFTRVAEVFNLEEATRRHARGFPASRPARHIDRDAACA